MSSYIFNNKFPIQLYYKYDSIAFGSFIEIKIYNENFRDRISKYELGGIFKEDCELVIESILDFFPYLIFSPVNIIKKDFLLKEIESIHNIINPERLYKIFGLRIDHEAILSYLINIKEDNNDVVSVNYADFITKLFKYLYRYAFFEIASSIAIDNNMKSIVDLINEYKDYKIDRSSTNNLNYKRLLNMIIPAFENFISGDKSIVDTVFAEFEIFGKNSSLAILFYSIIESTITLSNSITTKKKYKILRPLFYEIVCPICYPDCYSLGSDSGEVITQYKSFRKNL